MNKSIFVLVLAVFASLSMLTPESHASSCPLTNSQDQIEGCVVDSTTGNPVSGLNVYLVSCGKFILSSSTTTDSNGYFSFQGNSGFICIAPVNSYPVSVNGVTPLTHDSPNHCYHVTLCNLVGQKADNPAWGQWAGDVGPTSFPSGHAQVAIQLPPGAMRDVPFAALYSDTGFASLTFSTSTATGISESFSGSALVTAGFDSSETNTQVTTFGPFMPNTHTIVAYPYYVIPFYCAGISSYNASGFWGCSQGPKTIGVSGPVPSPPNGPGSYDYISTSEYLNPKSLPNSGQSFNCSILGPQSLTSQQDLTGSSSFGFTTPSVSFYGVSVSLSYSVTTSSSTGSSTQVSISSTDSQKLPFLIYPAIGTCPSPPGGLSFGPEVHVWDVNPTQPDFSIFANPTSLSLSPTNIGSSTLSLTGYGGFNGPVPLITSAPSFISVSLSNPNPTVSSSTVTSIASITVGGNAPCGTYPVTITGTNTQFGLVHSATISVTTPAPAAGDFCISANPNSITLGGYLEVRSGGSTITLTSVGGFSKSVSLSASAPSGISVSFSPTSVSVPSGGSATSAANITQSSAAGTYTVTITGTSNSPTITHSTNVTVIVQPTNGRSQCAPCTRICCPLSPLAPGGGGGAADPPSAKSILSHIRDYTNAASITAWIQASISSQEFNTDGTLSLTADAKVVG